MYYYQCHSVYNADSNFYCDVIDQFLQLFQLNKDQEKHQKNLI